MISSKTILAATNQKIFSKLSPNYHVIAKEIICDGSDDKGRFEIKGDPTNLYEGQEVTLQVYPPNGFDLFIFKIEVVNIPHPLEPNYNRDFKLFSGNVDFDRSVTPKEITFIMPGEDVYVSFTFKPADEVKRLLNRPQGVDYNESI